jgi:hypothetical protein
VSRRARTRAAAAALVALIAGGTLAFGQFSGTFAIFTSETENQNAVFKGSWIPAPSGATSSLDGTPYSQEHLAWTSGHSAATPSPNPVTGQTILYADGGDGTSASCGSYSSFGTVASTATTDDATGTNLGDWWCFEVQSTSSAATTSGSWTAGPLVFTPRQILVPLSVLVTNGGTGSNRMNSGDTIKITFNQNVNTPATHTFCGVNNGANDVIFIGDTKASGATCTATDTYTIGKITGVTVSATITALTETVTMSGTNGWTSNVMTVKITANSTSTATFGTPVFLTSTSVTAVTGSQVACQSTAGPTCTTGPTGTF